MIFEFTRLSVNITSNATCFASGPIVRLTLRAPALLAGEASTSLRERPALLAGDRTSAGLSPNPARSVNHTNYGSDRILLTRSMIGTSTPNSSYGSLWLGEEMD